MGRRLFIRLSARQECDAWNSCRDTRLQQPHGFFRDLIDAGAFGAFFAGDRHVGLEHHAFEGNAIVVQLLEGLLEYPLGYLVAAVDIVVAVHQYFGFYDRRDLGRLAKCRIARERMSIGVNGAVGRNAGPDIDHSTPFREARALLVIFRQAVGELVEPDGDNLVGASWQRLGSLVDLDTGDRSGLLDQLDQWHAVAGLLPDGFVVQDDARDAVAHGVGRTEQQLAIVASIILGVLDADRIKTPLDRAGGLVGRQNALSGRYHCVCDLVQFNEVHGIFSV